MRKLIIPLGLVFLGLTAFTAKKVFEIDDVIDKLSIGIDDVASPRITWDGITAKLRFNIFNDSIHELNVHTLGLITIEKLFIYDAAGIEIATALVNQDKLNIPARGAWLTDWINVQIDLASALNIAFSPDNIDFTKYNYKFAIDVAGFGKYMIG